MAKLVLQLLTSQSGHCVVGLGNLATVSNARLPPSGNRTLAKWEQKRLHTMRQLLTRNTAALAAYAVRVN